LREAGKNANEIALAGCFTEYAKGKDRNQYQKRYKNSSGQSSIVTAPFDRELELSGINNDGTHALVFSRCRIPGGWLKAETKERIDI